MLIIPACKTLHELIEIVLAKIWRQSILFKVCSCVLFAASGEGCTCVGLLPAASIFAKNLRAAIRKNRPYGSHGCQPHQGA